MRFEQSLDVAQNNVSNASTAGYAKQLATLERAAVPAADRTAGRSSGRRSSIHAGRIPGTGRALSDQRTGELPRRKSQALSGIEPIFDVTGQTGIVAALNSMFQSFSAWSANPDSAAARQDVLSKAQDLGASFQQAASVLSSVTSNVGNKIDSTVSQINTLAAQVRDYNVQQSQGRRRRRRDWTRTCTIRSKP